MQHETFIQRLRGKGAYQILDQISSKRVAKTPAQFSNLLSLTAIFYENFWRRKSIRLLSGQNFSLQDEANLLNDWLEPNPDQTILDVGCSTAFYARSILDNSPKTMAVAIDYSWPMLYQAQKMANRENRPVYFLRADAENLPFEDNVIDATCCGGTLNEFHSPAKALSEMFRVLKPSGKVFLMYLSKSNTITGRAAQKIAGPGGISFWSDAESNELFHSVGFTSIKQEKMGIVRFELLSKPEPE